LHYSGGVSGGTSNGAAPPDPALQDFVDCRGHPALFFILNDALARSDVVELYDVLAERKFDEIDIVIHSGGGDIHAAYQTIQLLRMHAKWINACVPFWAKSAATLLCIGADRIALGEHAELGPLDVQIYEEKKAGKGNYNSALNPFKTLEQLQAFSVEGLYSAMDLIVDRYALSYDEALRHATAFVEVTTGPLIGRLDPEKLGAYSRELSVASDYGERLLKRYSNWNPPHITQTIQQLVYGYPSHDYIIDFVELLELGFDVELFQTEEARSSAKGLLPIARSGKRVVTLVEPSVSAAAPSGLDGSETMSPVPDPGQESS
jgi:hypothetical protein